MRLWPQTKRILILLLVASVSQLPLPIVHTHRFLDGDALAEHIYNCHRNTPHENLPKGWHFHFLRYRSESEPNGPVDEDTIPSPFKFGIVESAGEETLAQHPHADFTTGIDQIAAPLPLTSCSVTHSRIHNFGQTYAHKRAWRVLLSVLVI